MEIDYKHELPGPDARSRLEALADYLASRHGIAFNWLAPGRAQFSGRYMVVKIAGELTVDDRMVRFRGEDPGFLWRKKATEYIQSKLSKYLDPRTSLADLPRGA